MKHTILQVFVYIFSCMRIYDKFYLGHRSILFYYLGFSINRLNVQFYLDCAKFCTAVLCQRCTCNRIMCNEITITLRTYIATRSQKLNTRPHESGNVSCLLAFVQFREKSSIYCMNLPQKFQR